MEKQQEVHVLSSESGAGLTGMQEEMRGLTNSCRQQLHDLTRLRIERNKAARHARCAVMRTKQTRSEITF
jgi:hypothetical protein